ncbi:alpha/beta fold hydrolase [Mycoplasmoides alvi]|uniref:alpha/beta fold hydrolase n=1 Tax=Mycoplasmoides alvi TaxID=78580 RepID=UPI00051C44F7|nr:alpha/beta hydrolase [Mycoplasmoides alvi]
MNKYEYFINDEFEYYYRPAKNKNQQTIIFCHGYAANCYYHNSFSDQISDNDYYSIVFPGHGELSYNPQKLKVSYYAKYLANWIKKMNFSKIILIGHSMGGAIAVCATNMLSKDIVDKLILVSPMNSTSVYKGIKFKTTFRPKPKKMKQFLYKFSRSLFFDKRSIYDDPINGEMLLKNDLKYYKDHANAFLLLNNQLGSFNELLFIKNNYKNLDTKTFLILGECDSILPIKKTIKRLKHDVKDIWIIQMLRTGHLPFIERSIDYFKIIQNIINEKSLKNVY